MMKTIWAILSLLLFIQLSFSQKKQEEKEWGKVYRNLNALEIPEVREAFLLDVKALEKFLQKYPDYGRALFYLKDEIFHLLYWGGGLDSSYLLKYLDVLTRYINLPDGVYNGCPISPTRCKMMAVRNRCNAYLHLGHTTKACADCSRAYHYFETDTTPFTKYLKADTNAVKIISLCK